MALNSHNMLSNIKKYTKQSPLKFILLGTLFFITMSCDFSTDLPIQVENSKTPTTAKVPKKTFDSRYYNPELGKKETITLKGKVVKVTDGDTIDLLVDGEAVRIRLSHIDAPERRNGQPYSRASTKRLGELCDRQEIVVKGANELDRYKRFLGELYTLEGVNLNKILVEEGLAWHYKYFSKDEDYAELESNAQINKRGLWKEKDPIAPWDWRKMKKAEIELLAL